MQMYEKTGILTTKDLRLPSQKQLGKGVAIHVWIPVRFMQSL